jgi:glutathione synthase/RimK-type ligase-like ATP-grasp enzyme
LLWGVPGDAPMDAVRAALEQRKAPVRFLDQQNAAEMSVELSIAADGRLTGCIIDPEGEIDLKDIGATYLRPYETSKACGITKVDDPAYLQATLVDTRLIAWADLSPTPVVNRPARMAVNNSKPYQLTLISGFGFNVPDTLVTTDEMEVRRFIDRRGSAIYKSVSGVRSIVSRLEAGQPTILANVANCPTQFQEYIPGVDVRVHVAGEAVLATQIASEADDYRYAGRSGAGLVMESVDLPEEFANQCRRMARGMGLYFAGIDFRHTPAGSWYCLEVNPSPGFTFYEAGTGQAIAAAAADLLVELDRSALHPPALTRKKQASAS